MGKPSDQRRSARRLGKRERARVKTGPGQGRGKAKIWVQGASGLGAGTFEAEYGRKKANRVHGFIRKLDEGLVHLGGEPVKPESGIGLRDGQAGAVPGA